MTAKEQVVHLLAQANIQVGGTRPWDIRVHDERFYARVLAQANLGLGESYMDGWWDCQALDQFFHKLLLARLDKRVQPLSLLPHVAKSKLLNLQNTFRSKRVAEEHYDVGNDLYQAMLDKNMQYTCGYWRGAKTLDQAQLQKLELVARKLKLKPGMTVLELGGGFGGLARYLATKYRCRVTSYNISKEQVSYARAWCKGLPISFVQEDYREAAKLPAASFDRVVSIGLLEHIGHKNYRKFFDIIQHALRDDGIALVHSIGSNKTVWYTDRWIDKYIFPHGHLPSIKQIGEATETKFVVEDWHNFGADYDKTLMGWDANSSRAWMKLDAARYNQRFQRMWRYYLLSCAGAFRARNMQLWQLVLTKRGLPGGYERPEL